MIAVKLYWDSVVLPEQKLTVVMSLEDGAASNALSGASYGGGGLLNDSGKD